MMKSENFYGFRTQTTNWRILLSRWSWSDECSFFLDRVFLTECLRCSCPRGFAPSRRAQGVHTHTHLLHANFSAHSSCNQICTSSCVSHTRMAQGHEKGLLHVHVVDLHLTFSSLTHPCCSLTVTSRPFLTLTSTRSCRTYLSYKAQDTRNSARPARSLAIWPSPPSTHKVVNVYPCFLTCLPFLTCCNHRFGVPGFSKSFQFSGAQNPFLLSMCIAMLRNLPRILAPLASSQKVRALPMLR